VDKRAIVLEEKGFTSGQMTQICRVAAFGITAAGVLTDRPEVAALGAAAIAFDYLQYFFGYRLTVRALNTEIYTLGTGCWRWVGRFYCFYLKQIAVAGAVIAWIAT